MTLRFLFIYLLLTAGVLLRVILAPIALPFNDGEAIALNTRIISSPQDLGNSKRVQVSLEGRDVTLILPKFSKTEYGQLVEVSGIAQTKVLANGQVVNSIYYPRISPQQDFVLPFQLASLIRKRVSESFHSYLSPSQASLLMGIVFGISSDLDKETKTIFQTIGVMHVIAASGMNVTLLAGFLLPIFMRVLTSRQSILLTIALLCFYTLLAGLSASIVRATLMASLGFIGLLLGRQKTALVSLYLTGCMMLLISPTLVSDIGFQLSFAATLGIMLIAPLLPSFRLGKLSAFFSEDLKSTLSAQITTTPILVYYFKTLGLLAVVVNILVLWTIPPLMILGSVSAIVSLVSISLGGLLSLLTMPLLAYFLTVTRLVASVSPQLTLTSLPLSLVLGYYLLLSAILLFVSRLPKKQLETSERKNA